MKIRVQRPSEAHDWFAWYPVVAEQKTPTGLAYFWTWMHTVKRSYLRVGGASQWVYTTETRG